MRYGEPSISGQLQKLRDAGCQRIIVLPMYPQPAAATSASTFDAVADTLRTWRSVPPIRFVAPYADEPRFLRVVADSVRRFWATHGGDRPQRLLFSFHGVPQKTLLAGDPVSESPSRIACLLCLSNRSSSLTLFYSLVSLLVCENSATAWRRTWSAILLRGQEWRDV
jgi:protoheme ferro-lyase